MEKTKTFQLAERIFSLAKEREDEFNRFKTRVKNLAEQKVNQTFIENKTSQQKEIESEIRKYCLKLLRELY